MKRIVVHTFVKYQIIPTIEIGFYDNRRKNRAWKYIALNIGRWKICFNYGLVHY